MIVTKKDLNIEHRFISIGVVRIMTKEQYNGIGTSVGLWIYLWVS